jgi:hypothetical protein
MPKNDKRFQEMHTFVSDDHSKIKLSATPKFSPKEGVVVVREEQPLADSISVVDPGSNCTTNPSSLQRQSDESHSLQLFLRYVFSALNLFPFLTAATVHSELKLESVCVWV